MLKEKTIGVVVPAYNEETQIRMVIESMPDFVDRIIVVNDKSTDNTEVIVKEIIACDPVVRPLDRKTENLKKTIHNEADHHLAALNKKEIEYFPPFSIVDNPIEGTRIILINNTRNTGVGGSIAIGYKWAKDNEIDCTAVMAGDGQMDPEELESICLPVVNGEVDYVKGNRLLHGSAVYLIPKVRFWGNSVLSLLTKIASGYWRISDTQTGYTAISSRALNSIKLYKIYRSYGMPNDMLVKLNMAYCTIREIPIKPIYRIGEKSKMRIYKVIPRISFLLMRSFCKRIWIKYFLKDFHPLFFLYNLSIVLFGASIPFLIKIFKYTFIFNESLNPVTVLAFIFLVISGFQFLLFGMWMDIQDNERLYK